MELKKKPKIHIYADYTGPFYYACKKINNNRMHVKTAFTEENREIKLNEFIIKYNEKFAAACGPYENQEIYHSKSYINRPRIIVNNVVVENAPENL